MPAREDFASELAPIIADTMFAGRVRHDVSVTSTNTLAMDAAAKGAPEGTVFLADEQTAGRGRGGHQWNSERDSGVYCSVILRPRQSSTDVLIMSLMTGVAVHLAVSEVTGLQADLRWPNDLLIGDKKFCGILTEMSTEGAAVRHCVLGIGINVNQSEFPRDLRAIATSLRLETGKSWSRVELAAALLKSLDREYSAMTADFQAARASIFERFAACSSYVTGAEVHVGEDDGYDGTTAGLDDRGFLKIKTPDGMRTVLSGGVRKLRP